MAKQFPKNISPVPAEIFKLWTEKKSRGDVTKLMEFTSLSKPIIIRALKHGYASPELILSISKYFSQKKSYSLQEIEHQALKILQGEE